MGTGGGGAGGGGATFAEVERLQSLARQKQGQVDVLQQRSGLLALQVLVFDGRLRSFFFFSSFFDR